MLGPDRLPRRGADAEREAAAQRALRRPGELRQADRVPAVERHDRRADLGEALRVGGGSRQRDDRVDGVGVGDPQAVEAGGDGVARDLAHLVDGRQGDPAGEAPAHAEAVARAPWWRPQPSCRSGRCSGVHRSIIARRPHGGTRAGPRRARIGRSRVGGRRLGGRRVVDRRRAPPAAPGSAVSSPSERQRDGHRRADAHGAVDRDRPAVGDDRGVGDRHAEPAATTVARPRRVGAVEALRDPGRHVGRHARPVVDDGDARRDPRRCRRAARSACRAACARARCRRRWRSPGGGGPRRPRRPPRRPSAAAPS